MKMQLKVQKINSKCSECSCHLAGKTGVVIFPNARTKRTSWLLCARCFLNIGDRFEKSEGYDVVSCALREEL